MKRVGVITFHASHNYGSMLQAYALQQVILGMGDDCEIINFRTKRQKKFYRPPFFHGRWIGMIRRFFLYWKVAIPLTKKYFLFESFLQNKYILSEKEYQTLDDLVKEDFKYDIFLSGSDQIWNTVCFDFDWAYFLSFVKEGKKIAYAPSMGPKPFVKDTEENTRNIKKYISSFDAVSVREQGAADHLLTLCGVHAPIMLDPTLLLSGNYWEEMINQAPLVKGEYIFLYTPWYDEQVFLKAEMLSNLLGIKVVIAQIYEKNEEHKWRKKHNFQYLLSVGPIEFLNLCKNAKWAIGLSFHLVVFSILLQTPFIVIDGMDDSRIQNLLTLTKLESRSMPSSMSDFSQYLSHIDFKLANDLIENERQRCLKWLKTNLT